MIFALVWNPTEDINPASPASELSFEFDTLDDCINYARNFAESTPHYGQLLIGDKSTGRILAAV